MKCVCHSAHLCASYACGKLPRSVEELLRDVYNYFAHSAKRQSEYAVVQHFLDIETENSESRLRLTKKC